MDNLFLNRMNSRQKIVMKEQEMIFEISIHGFSLRRTFEYAAGGNPGRTPLIGKMAIFGWKLSMASEFAYRDEV